MYLVCLTSWSDVVRVELISYTWEPVSFKETWEEEEQKKDKNKEQGKEEQ